jgi:hypothetical protein
MVKNNTGGNKSKKQGRKYAAPTLEQQGQQKVRRVEEVGEIYAAITKIFGGTSCKVVDINGVTRDCIIRRKFNSAGGKRQNMISIGTWVLVGIRDWEVRANGEQKCDLLEVYSASEKDRLKQIENNFNFKVLNIASDVSTSNNRGANIAEQGSKYDENCDIVTFNNNNDNDKNDETSPNDESTNSSTNSSDEEEDIIAKPTTIATIAKPTKIAPHINNMKNHNDWMINVDDI